MKITFFIVAAVAVSCTSCALPSHETQQSFVPAKELSAVEYSQEGLSFMARNRFAEAVISFYQASFLYPDILPFKLNLAIALRELGDVDQSEKILQSIISQNGYRAPAQHALASLYFNLGAFQSGNAQFDSAISQEINRNDFLKATTIALTAAQYNDAVAQVDTALCFALLAQGLQDIPLTRTTVGRLYLAQGMYDSVLKLGDKSPGTKRDQLELELVKTIARLGLKKYDSTLKELQRLELSVRKSPELLPEIQILRVVAQILLQTSVSKVTMGEVLANLSKEEIQTFHSAYSGIANTTPQARYWPHAVRSVLELQDKEYLADE